MTEAQWLNCSDPIKMLSHLRAEGNDRKTLLLIVACMARIRDRIAADGMAWIAAAERAAEGRLDLRELSYHYDEVGESGLDRAYYAASPAEKGVVYAVMEVFYGVWYSPANIGGTELPEAGVRPRDEEKRSQARLLRDFFGNPFRPLPPLAPSWAGCTVTKRATALYEERRFGDLPVLADALEEAGCLHAELLGHLRGPGPHVRGCFVLDWVLGKE